MPKTTIRCVCGAWIQISGQYADTLSGRKHFIDQHRECREKLDSEIKQINLHQGIDAVTRTMR